MKKELVDFVFFISMLVISVLIKEFIGFEYTVLGFLVMIGINQYSNK
jgi:hypothetical protein